ncbi:YceI family protein [candidate division KSB1 bacterium]|nr:YceI family protein [candidate division KSB1 bacterium]
MKTIYKLIASMMTLMALNSFATAQTLQLDTSESKIEWIGRKVTGQHNGTLNFASGSIKMDEGTVKSGEFKIDMASLTVLDLTDPDMNAKLTGHLKSDDFFSVATHPKAVLTLKSVESKDKQNSLYHVSGDLTIKGITNEIVFPATIIKMQEGYHAHADFKLDRTLWDVRFRSGKFFENLGDKLIYDDFDVKLDLRFLDESMATE